VRVARPSTGDCYEVCSGDREVIEGCIQTVEYTPVAHMSAELDRHAAGDGSPADLCS
jgi:hypothetical protein